MPKRTDIKRILVIGSGPIVIGQACEFDYSGTQGLQALRQEGYYTILVNSNPATIMTDPEIADRTYVEPLLPDVIEKIIAREKPDALLPTLGGQTALNLALLLSETGVLKKYNVELIGASQEAIEKAEDRVLFKAAMAKIGLEVPRSGYVQTLAEAHALRETFGFPIILRPSFTLGGSGGGIAYNLDEFEEKVEWALAQSPRRQVLVEESVLGWKEYELEVIRDRLDNTVIICSIENVDPMGVHTGDSITVAPAMTLTDKEYQLMRDAARDIIREIGVDTGGSNVQFAVHPETGRIVVVEMNPRVSRSSALASKATGFPIAKVAAKLAVGYALHEIPNDITSYGAVGQEGWFPASFEPTIDYVVVKYPRFAFEKFPGADTTLTTQMKSVGEAMAIGRTFREALGKSIRSLEIGRSGFEPLVESSTDDLKRQITVPSAERLFQIAELLRREVSIDDIYSLCKIDKWFLTHIALMIETEKSIEQFSLEALDAATLYRAKNDGLSDSRIASLLNPATTAEQVRARRVALGVEPQYKRVDTCAAEFEAKTPYLYSTYETPLQINGQPTVDEEVAPSTKQRVVILGGGPNRIGQGIEFDYCCVHATLALKEAGYETIMVNCNPETVSTDYDTADRLYFEPLTFEDVIAIVEREKPIGVIVQFGGQTPLRLAGPLARAGVPILGTSAEAIDRAEDRARFGDVLNRLKLRAPAWGTATSLEEALTVSESIGYPLMVRPSYVLGGRAMEVVYSREELKSYVRRALALHHESSEEKRINPLLLDRFLSDAIEVDVDAVSDGKETIIGGVMEHIEEAGIHSGDSTCALPPFSLSPNLIAQMVEQMKLLARELHVVGLMNVQFAIKDGVIYLLEVNPRASRTVPFVSKVTGQSLAKIAALVMVGKSLAELGVTEIVPRHTAVKEPVFPFVKFPGTDTILGPEMRSTGEVMGIDQDFAIAFAKAQWGAGTKLPTSGRAFISVRDADKPAAAEVARQLSELGFEIVATHGTARFFNDQGVPARGINKVPEGRPHCVDAIANREFSIVVNTTIGAQSIRDSYSIRRTALIKEIAHFTTIAAAKAATAAIRALQQGGSIQVMPLQEYHATQVR